MKFTSFPGLSPQRWFLGFALLFVISGCSYWKDKAPVTPGEAVFEGTVKWGESYRHEVGNGLIFSLEDEKGPWVIRMFHESHIDKDLVYPVNPPYRSEGHLMIGQGYGKSAKESVQDFPRTFSFLFRERDIPVAWDAVNQILWPKTPDDQEKGKTQIAILPTGKGTMEVLSVDYFPAALGSPNAGSIHELKFRVKLTWPYSQAMP